MLGFEDVWVAAALWLCIGSTVLCAWYGVAHWNTDEEGEGEKEEGRRPKGDAGEGKR